ncbi:MCE family protein [Rhodococcus sp. NPDC127530]|uniref:MCE family protein n=1 Tax=unclassified Rhodococcus (in: high G+C Gram-positive bacteria) TaxID=192944 RepID=UPI0036436F7D
MSHTLRRISACTALTLTAATLTGCGFKGVNSIVLPGEGTGDDSYTVSLQFDSVANLVPNSEVKLNDVTVGTVKSIRLDGWQPIVEVGIRGDVVLPADTTAAVSQKSLLGAQIVELAVPPDGQNTGHLDDGAVIPLDRTSKFPETEELLGSLSLWLNGGAVDHLRTITVEMNKSFGGNDRTVRNLIDQLNALVGTLDSQRYEITSLIDQMDNFGKSLTDQKVELGSAIERLEPGLTVLNRQSNDIVNAAGAMATFGDLGTQAVEGSRESLLSIMSDLQPILDSLVTAAPDLPNAADILLTLLFPVSTHDNVLKGDYLSAAGTFNLTTKDLGGAFATAPIVTAPPTDAGRTPDPLQSLLIPALPHPGQGN